MSEEKSAHYSVTWQEEEYIHPPNDFVGQANLTDPKIFERFSLENFPECFKEFADLLDWDQYWHTTLDTSDAPCWKWFVGGKINASYNCVDRHLDKYKNKTAIHFVPEPEDEPIVHLTYQDLYRRVNETAAVLRDFAGLKAGDRVTLHLPMTPELPITMLACARLGVIHSQVFAGFSGQACGERIWDSESRVLITIDSYYRSGKLLDHKAIGDVAVEVAKKEGQDVDKVLVWRRYPGKYSSAAPVVEGRDFFMDELLKEYRGKTVEPVSMPAEDILFLMYTSGSTGRPKGAQHSIGGYLAYVTWMSKNIQDIHPEDVYWCMADIGWITGHSFIVYGPLACAASSVIYEGVPTYPDAGRIWRIAEELDVNIFHTSPTAIRQLRKAGPDEPEKYNYDFKHMTTVGEPIEPAVWRWYYDVVGKKKAAIVDTWWQTETGGFLCSTVPGLAPMKPGSAGPGVPGIHPVIFDDEGNEIPAGAGKAGNICIKNPWPGLMQTIWKDRDRFVSTYYGKYNTNPDSKDWRDWPYMAGDAAVLAKDGYVRILGRVDDVINVAGHRLGTKEIESAALTVQEVAEAAVIAAKDEIKGVVPDLYVALKPGFEASDELAAKISQAVSTVVGKIARPRSVHIVPDMPKTRSGKIMRRILASISNQTEVGDVTSLANPDVVELILKKVQG
ncbi:acetyl-coenzyme A synthetase [Desulfotomaculum arcticum]|uniref:Acetate--CoA ligase n=1 Tax=Desulfotruncus arcticus DSM 17038 TaxID=1121424 RepID=A0A1I2NBG9_9FIRM|nr:acetate--CoA ligase [Desulfotruncus arcticus]SFG00199.1 acetyl-coenzyme A synthetase [Desulfotomaculum arcticum] [Desulfotruncus arcticus DSM 17038]